MRLQKRNEKIKEITEDELLAHVISKISSFEWARVTMFWDEDLFENPPMFCWRFAGDNKEIQLKYQQLEECIISFEGKTSWTMYKGSGKNGESRRNYSIEPEFIRSVRKKYGNESMAIKLRKEYENDIFNARADVVPLCRYIEKQFNLGDKAPNPPNLDFR